MGAGDSVTEHCQGTGCGITCDLLSSDSTFHLQRTLSHAELEHGL